MRLQALDALLAATTPDAPASLVSRPTGVAHIYTGPLTPGGAVPRNRRPVCNARTKRLYVDGGGSPTSGSPRFVCARCSARLAVSPAGGRAEHPSPRPTFLTRSDDKRRYAGLTVVDVYLSARFAESVAELDECALALTLCFSKAEAAAEHAAPTGRTFSNLPKWIDIQRRGVAEAEREENLVALAKSHGPYIEALINVDNERQREAHRRRRRQYV